jgi:hypothetical protein
MFVDASAIVAILTREPEADACSERVGGGARAHHFADRFVRGGPGHLQKTSRERRGGRGKMSVNFST